MTNFDSLRLVKNRSANHSSLHSPFNKLPRFAVSARYDWQWACSSHLGQTFLQSWTASLSASKTHGIPFHMRMHTHELFSFLASRLFNFSSRNLLLTNPSTNIRDIYSTRISAVHLHIRREAKRVIADIARHMLNDDQSSILLRNGTCYCALC